MRLRHALLSAWTAALFAAGCASVPPPPPAEPEEEGFPAPETPAPPAAPAPAIETRPPAPPPAPAAPPAAAKPKPWDVRFSNGSALALVDGVRVYLGNPVKTDWKTKKTAATWLDNKYTLGPLLEAPAGPRTPGRRFRVCLDPGHGGSDPGTRSGDGRAIESALALDVARRVASLLEKDGFEAVLTRTDDRTTQTLEERPAKARRWRADAFVSIHFNANPTGSARGLETYVFPARTMESTTYTGRRPSAESARLWQGNANDADNVRLGFAIQRRLLAATKLPDRGLRRARFVVLREATVPATLVECGFLSSPSDLAYLRTEAGRDALARGIYEGLCDFAFGTLAPGLPARVPGAAPAPPGLEPKDCAAAPPAPAGPGLEFVLAAGVRAPPPVIPKPDDTDPARRAVREAALRAAGLLPPAPARKNTP